MGSRSVRPERRRVGARADGHSCGRAVGRQVQPADGWAQGPTGTATDGQSAEKTLRPTGLARRRVGARTDGYLNGWAVGRPVRPSDGRAQGRTGTATDGQAADGSGSPTGRAQGPSVGTSGPPTGGARADGRGYGRPGRSSRRTTRRTVGPPSRSTSPGGRKGSRSQLI